MSNKVVYHTIKQWDEYGKWYWCDTEYDFQYSPSSRPSELAFDIVRDLIEIAESEGYKVKRCKDRFEVWDNEILISYFGVII